MKKSNFREFHQENRDKRSHKVLRIYRHQNLCIHTVRKVLLTYLFKLEHKVMSNLGPSDFSGYRLISTVLVRLLIAFKVEGILLRAGAKQQFI